MIVVLPAPFGPSRPTIWPGAMSKLTPRSASTEPYDFLSSDTSIMKSTSEKLWMNKNPRRTGDCQAHANYTRRAGRVRIRDRLESGQKKASARSATRAAGKARFGRHCRDAEFDFFFCRRPGTRAYVFSMSFTVSGGALHAAGDQARASVAGEVVVGPLNQDQQPVVELGDVEQVDEEPRQPGQAPVELERADVARPRRPGRWSPCCPCPDSGRAGAHGRSAAPGSTSPRNGPAAWRPARRPAAACRSAPSSDAMSPITKISGVAGQGQVRQDFHAAAAVDFGAGWPRPAPCQAATPGRPRPTAPCKSEWSCARRSVPP